jgi:hypothetical protein
LNINSTRNLFFNLYRVKDSDFVSFEKTRLLNFLPRIFIFFVETTDFVTACIKKMLFADIAGANIPRWIFYFL